MQHESVVNPKNPDSTEYYIAASSQSYIPRKWSFHHHGAPICTRPCMNEPDSTANCQSIAQNVISLAMRR